MTGIFTEWQPIYAEHRVATFPVRANKTPAIANWHRIGLPASSALAARHRDADAFGFVTGRRSGVTIVDVDTTDEKIAEDTIRRHGRPGIVTRTASRKFHLLYRYNGERRRIRPWKPLPIDVLGNNGYAVAAPSRTDKGTYEIIHGRVDDLDLLRPAAGLDSLAREAKPAKLPSDAARPISEGERNSALWRHCMRTARVFSEFNELLDEARTFNARCLPPMEDEEVMKTAQSAWKYTETGQNRFGQHGAWFPIEEVARMIAYQDAFILLAFLRAHNGPWSTFMCTNGGIAETLGWHRKRLAEA
jgi:hypothetical protein